MSKMVRSFVAMVVVGLAFAGCDDGFTNDEATELCEEHRDNSPGVWDAAAFDGCVSCYEECGDSCSIVDTVLPPKASCAEF